MMKAAVYTKYGPPEVVQVKELPIPTIQSTEILVRIHGTSVNRTDCGFLRAKPFISRFFSGLLRPKNNILGNEFTGEVVEVGNEIKDYQKGDRVFGLRGVQFGCHAQYAVMTEQSALAHLPKNIDYLNAAGVCEGAFYAMNYMKAIKIQSGDSILINGSTGAIGTAGVQLAKHFGAKITAVGNTKNIDLVKSLGADRVIDYLKEDFRSVLDGEQFDYIFDAVGKSSYGQCKHLLKPNGIFFATELGPYWNNVWYSLWTAIFKKMPGSDNHRVIFPLPADDKAGEMIQFFKELIEQGSLKPVVDRVYPLDDIVEAYRYVEAGEKTGSVVIDME